MSKQRIQVMLDADIAERIEIDAAKRHIGSSTLIRQIICNHYEGIDSITNYLLNIGGVKDTLKGVDTTNKLMNIAKKQNENSGIDNDTQ